MEDEPRSMNQNKQIRDHLEIKMNEFFANGGKPPVCSPLASTVAEIKAGCVDRMNKSSKDYQDIGSKFR
jgi:hypothetical protein